MTIEAAREQATRGQATLRATDAAPLVPAAAPQNHWIDREAQTIEDLRLLARRRLPRGVFDFLDRGTDDDRGVAANRRAFDHISICPKMLVDVSKRSLGIDLFGRRCAAPIAIAPTGSAGLLWYEGEVAVAKAAAEAGLPFTISTASITSMEKVAERAGGRLWFQIYLWPRREMSHQLMRRAKAAGYEALVVTVDTPIAPHRQYTFKSGFSLPFKINRRNALDLALHPRWLLGVVGRYLASSGMPTFENFPDEVRRSIADAPTGRISLPFCDSLTWDEFRDLRRMWDGPVMVKGLLDPGDAERAVACGADGVIVSNHGGRNLDSALATLQALPEIADRVGHKATVMIDSGFRSGSDIVKALALGAKAAFVGRAPLYGVASAGEAGARRALTLLREEVDRTLAFMGCPGVEALNRDFLRVAPDFLPQRLSPAKLCGQ